MALEIDIIIGQTANKLNNEEDDNEEQEEENRDADDKAKSKGRASTFSTRKYRFDIT